MTVFETPRLTLSRLSTEDAAFILRLVNEPAFIRYIGDKGVRTLEDARNYLLTGPVASYDQHGFGMYLVSLSDQSVPIGICGLIKREGLDDVDIGFAFLPEFWGQGYASESAQVIVGDEALRLELRRIVAITDPENIASIRVVEKLGLRFERKVQLPGDDAEINLYGIDLDATMDYWDDVET